MIQVEEQMGIVFPVIRSGPTERLERSANFRGRGYPGGTRYGNRRGPGAYSPGRIGHARPMAPKTPSPPRPQRQPLFNPTPLPPRPFGKRGLSDVQRPLTPKGTRFLKLHPYFRIASTALDIYDKWKAWDNGAPGGYHFGEGWTRTCYTPWTPNISAPEPGAGIRYGSASSATSSSCDANLVPWNLPYGSPIPPDRGPPHHLATQGVNFGPWNTLGNRMNIEESWRRESGSEPPPEYTVPRPPSVIPPEWSPPAQPEPLPWPMIPYQPNTPVRETGPGPERRPTPPRDPFGEPYWEDDPDLSPGRRPRPKPPAVPEPDPVEPDPTEPGPAPGKPGPGHLPRRPRRGVRERKTLNKFTRGVLEMWSAATEVPDWIDAYWTAMPQWFQDRYAHRPYDEKVVLMAENIHLMDAEKAIYNTVYNIVEDAVAGKIIQALDGVGIGVGFNGVPYVKHNLVR